jgi:hypothetical protein
MMTEYISYLHDINFKHKRALLNLNHKSLKALDSELDCFVQFEGDEKFAILVNETEGVIDVDPNEEIVGFESWARDRLDQTDLPLSNTPFNSGYDGSGFNIYVLDTGIYQDHEDFTGRAFYGMDFINESELPEDFHGHGTHCASLAAGKNYGIATNANVYTVKVLSRYGSGSTKSVIEGVQWASNHVKETSVISMSLGGPRNTALDKAVKDASKNNIVIVAAGNENQDACNLSPARMGGKARTEYGVITVASTTKEDQRSSFSNYGPCVDIFSPGSNILGASIKGPNLAVTMSGTSMATPLVAGVATTLLQKNHGNLQNTLNNLFSIGVGNKISSEGKGTTNLLVQVESYTGPPTPPTLSPTPPPSFSDPKLCMKNPKNKCFDYKDSMFNTDRNILIPVEGNLTVPNFNEDELCTKSSKKFTDEIVIVKRGSCYFFDKVKHAENAGAKAVIITMDDAKEDLFPPGYYGDETTQIPSCMVSYNSGEFLKKKVGESIVWGIQELQKDYNRPIKTNAPTSSPTTLEEFIDKEKSFCGSRTKKQCRRLKRCFWRNFNNTNYTCYSKRYH